MANRERTAANTLYVRNLDSTLRHDDVQEMFERYGRIREVVIPLDYHSRAPKGFAFIEYEDRHDAESALNALDKTKLGGREIEVEFARGDRKTPSEMIAKQRGPRDRDHFGGRSEPRHRYEQRGRGDDSHFRRRSPRDFNAPPRGRERFGDRERDRFEQPRGDRFNDRFGDRDRERRNDRLYEPRDRSPIARDRPDRADRLADRGAGASDRFVRDRAPRERVLNEDRNGDRFARNGDRMAGGRDRDDKERIRSDRHLLAEDVDDRNDRHDPRGRRY